MAKTATKDRAAVLFVELPADVKQALAILPGRTSGRSVVRLGLRCAGI